MSGRPYYARHMIIQSIILIVLLLPSLASADTIYFKDGRRIVGDIYKESSYSVKIKTGGGQPRTYYRHEIDRIERGGGTLEVTPELQEISQQKRELIRRLLEANGARDYMNQTFTRIISQAPEESREEVRQLLKTDEIIQRLIPIYAGYYTEEELRELLMFYLSPTGRKHLETIPRIMEETMEEAVIYFKEKAASQE